MDNQTILNIGLALLSAYLAVRNFMLTAKKENQRESQEMTEIRVQLDNVMVLLRDMQKDIRTSTADFRALSDRVLIIETNLGNALADLSKLKEEKNGKS